jgi:glycosyltransferase involved in cell wall biosynthesis
MKTTIIVGAFPAPSETFVLRHVGHFHADVVCQQFHPELLQNRNLVGAIACASESPDWASRNWAPVAILRRFRWRALQLMRPAAAFSWSRSMHQCWSGYLDCHKPDVVLAEFAPNALGAMRECRRRGIPLVVHFHGYDATSLMRNAAYRQALSDLFEHVAAVICVSRFMREVLLDAGCPPGKLHAIPCGAPLQDFPFSDYTGNQPCTFLAVSRLVAGKGPMVTLEAFQDAYSKRPDIRLIIAGDGPMRLEITRYIQEHSLDQAVSIAGCVPNDEVRRLMAASTVFVQASLQDKNGGREGWGVSLAEALATGLPAIVSRSGGMVDLVTDGYNGFLFEEGDRTCMADRMLQLAGDPALRLRMGRAGRDHVEMVGSTEKNLRLLENVLREASRCFAMNGSPVKSLEAEWVPATRLTNGQERAAALREK